MQTRVEQCLGSLLSEFDGIIDEITEGKSEEAQERASRLQESIPFRSVQVGIGFVADVLGAEKEADDQLERMITENV